MNYEQSSAAVSPIGQRQTEIVFQSGETPPQEKTGGSPTSQVAKTDVKSIWIDGKEFRHLPSHEYYWVSCDGTIATTFPRGGRLPREKRVMRHAAPRIIGGSITSKGYRRFNLTAGPKHKNMWCHAAVLSAWVGPCPAGMECRHLDGRPGNNNLYNLKWGTRSENAHDRISHGNQRGDTHYKSVFRDEDVIKLRAEYITLSAVELHKRYPQWTHGAIIQAVSGKSYKHLPGAIRKGRYPGNRIRPVLAISQV